MNLENIKSHSLDDFKEKIDQLLLGKYEPLNCNKERVRFKNTSPVLLTQTNYIRPMKFPDYVNILKPINTDKCLKSFCPLYFTLCCKDKGLLQKMGIDS